MAEKQSPALQALHQGIQTELQGYTFYRKAAVVIQNPKGRQVFEGLMKDEKMHLRLLQVQYGSLVSEGRWLAMEQAREMEPGQEVEEIFPRDDNTLADMLSEGASDLEALEIALKFERDGYQLYEKSAAQTDDAQGKALYKFLAEQEQIHYDFIHRAKEYLQTEGAWYFDEQELPFFEG